MPKETSYRTEFPDYGELDFTLPTGFVDRSWHNDACPAWEHDGLRLRIMADYRDQSLSEVNPSPSDTPYHRFLVDRLDAEGCIDPDLGRSYATFDEALADIIAEAFVAALREWLTPDQWAEMRRANQAEGDSNLVCHSHDHCDANMAMYEAFRSLGMEKLVALELGDDTRGTLLWNAAWSIAKKRHLTNPTVAPRMREAGWTVAHTGGGCMAWDKPAPCGYVWITNEGNALEGDPAAREWYVGRYNDGAEGEAGIGPVTLDEALAAVDQLPDPGARQIVADDLADLLEEFKG